MTHAEAFTLLWLASGARYERLVVDAAAQAAHAQLGDRHGFTTPGLVITMHDAVDQAAERLRPLAAGDSLGAVELGACRDADAAP